MNITITDITMEEFIKIAKAFDTEERKVTPAPVKVEAPKIETEPENNLLRRAELAAVMNVCPQSISGWVKKGMPHEVEGGMMMFDVDKVRQWRKENIQPQKITRKKKPVSDFASWQRQMFEIIDKKKLDRGKTCGNVFRKMTSRYGVVWDQVKKDFYEANGYKPHSTMQMCHWLQTNNPVYRDMFDSILEGMVA